MNILITGGAGFIGSHLLDSLVEDGHHVKVLDNLQRGQRSYIEKHLSEGRAEFIEGDIRHMQTVEEACRDCRIVYHLAAQSNVIGAVTDLDYSFETNVTGTFNVLKGARDAGVRRFVFTSSREVYGEAQYLPVDENHPLQAKNAYGASKLAGEAYCRVFRNAGAMQLFVFRLANVYGPRDTERVIPIFRDKLRSGKPLTIYGGSQVIDFISVEYIVEILRRALRTDVPPTFPLNVGSGKGTNLYQLVDRLEELLHRKAEIKLEPERSVEVKSFIADISALAEKTGIRPPDDPLYFLKEMI